MNITCQEELLQSRGAFSSILNHQNGLSPMKNQSFNFPLKIKVEPKMAPILCGAEKGSLAQFQNDTEIRQEHHLSQDMRP
jgi:hypothetical protein